jgi:AhpD family alkylhydroperoxidase
MARIAGIPRNTRNPLLRFVFWMARRRFGGDVEPLRGYATRPPVLLGVAALELAMERARAVPAGLKKLAELRVAALVGCPFCLDFGSALVRGLGVPEAKLCHLNDYAESDLFSPLEKAVLAYADRATATPSKVQDEDVRRLLAHLGEAQLVELTAAIALENLRAWLNHALGYGAQGFAVGGACALPAPPHGAGSGVIASAPGCGSTGSSTSPSRGSAASRPGSPSAAPASR